MNTKQISKTSPKLPHEEQEHIAHTPIEDDHTKISVNEEHKTDDVDTTTLSSNSDTFHSWENEHEDIDRNYLK